MPRRLGSLRRSLVAFVVAAAVLATVGVAVARPGADAGRESTPAGAPRPHSSVPADFTPAALGAKQDLGRYFVTVDGASVATGMRSGETSADSQRATAEAARASQQAAVDATESAGGSVIFRYDTLLNGFSARMSAEAASALAERDDVASVEPVAIVRADNESSVPFIGSKKVSDKLGADGRGMTVAVVDTGIDYTHKNFGGKGTVAAYEANDPNVIEPGSFPTKKVIGGFDFVGPNYSVTDDDPTNDVPRPDPDPLDDGTVGDHGSHTAGSCCGKGVKGKIGPGVAPRAKLLALKVWDSGDSTADVLVAAFERAVDPNDDGSTDDAADVVSFSGGVDYGAENSLESLAAERVVDIGTVLVASAGNAGNQPVGGSAYIAGTPANAPGVISVAASIDEFEAQTVTVNSPSIELPDQGIMVPQDWGAPLPEGGLTDDLFDGRELDPPASPGGENPADAQLCDPLPAGSLAGETVLVFKGDTGQGDCAGSTKAFNAQEAGAQAVLLVSLFGGAPSALSSNGEAITIPVVMITANDGYALLDVLSPNPPAYNSGRVNATLNSETTQIDSYVDAMTDFTSEGPAPISSSLKPDISAPGYDIQSTDAGTGNKGQKFSGTSMAAPHVSGVAAQLLQLHSKWSPARIKAALMNQATQEIKDNLLGEPVSATVMGAGRVQSYESARTVSIASPGSLSYGLQFASEGLTETRKLKITNAGKLAHTYKLKGEPARYNDFATSPASVLVSAKGKQFAEKAKLKLKPHSSKTVKVQLTLDPAVIETAEQEYGLYYFHPNVDGNVTIKQNGAKTKKKKGKGGKKRGRKRSESADTLHVPWHVAPLAASELGISESALDLTSGPDTMKPTGSSGAGTGQIDLYELGSTDGLNSGGEEDIVGVGARSFTGGDLSDDEAAGEPQGTDPFAGISWLDFLADPDAPTEPIEFGVQTAGIHNTTETVEVDILVDAGADGVFEGDDEGIEADYVVVKLASPGGEVCVFDLSLADAFDDCSAIYFADYSNYNSNVIGLPVSAGDIGVTNAEPEFAYSAVVCTGRFSGDDAASFCDEAGGSKLNATDPALEIDPLTCGGFWDTSPCDDSDVIAVDAGSAGPGDDPSILALFPQNAPSDTPTVVKTDTGP